MAPWPREQRIGGRSDFLALLREHLNLLGDLFDDPGLASLMKRMPNHPAVARYRAIDDYIGSGILSQGTLDELTTAALDISTWAWDGRTGRPLPDEKVARLRSLDGEAFEDAMAELFYYGSLYLQGFSAQLVEATAKPDIAVDTSGKATWIEVKRLRPGAQPERVAKVIQHANKQLKTASPTCAGVLFLSVAPVIQRAVPGDSEPTELSPTFTEVTRVLGGNHCRSVHTAVVAWDELLTFPEADGRVLHAFQRRSAILQHRTPRGPLPWDAELLKAERTIEFRVRPAASPNT